MPRYYFDIHDGFELRDDVGRDIKDLRAARTEALTVITGLAAAEGEDSDGYTIVLDVWDEAGANVLTVRMVCQLDDAAERRLKRAS